MRTGKDLLQNLLNVDQEKRFSVHQALAHKWLEFQQPTEAINEQKRKKLDYLQFGRNKTCFYQVAFEKDIEGNKQSLSKGKIDNQQFNFQ